MDGTFFSAPGLFNQLYSLHALVSNSRGSAMICCAYFLLPDQQQATYVKMLQFLQTHCVITAEVSRSKCSICSYHFSTSASRLTLNEQPLTLSTKCIRMLR